MRRQGGAPLSDDDGCAVHLLHDDEGVLIGDVVADEHRTPILERRLLHDAADGLALVVGGRAHLHHVIALQQRQARLFAARQHRRQLRPHLLPQMRRLAVMHRKAGALRLDQDSGPVAHQGQHVRSKAGDVGLRAGAQDGLPEAETELRAVAAGDVRHDILRHLVDRGDFTARDDGERVAEVGGCVRQQARQIGRRAHLRRRRRDRHQRAVDVEEQGQGGAVAPGCGRQLVHVHSDQAYPWILPHDDGFIAQPLPRE